MRCVRGNGMRGGGGGGGVEWERCKYLEFVYELTQHITDAGTHVLEDVNEDNEVSSVL